MKSYIYDVFESFLDTHKEFTIQHQDLPPSPHKPRYSYIDTTADEEFNVHSLLQNLSDKELYFLYALMSQVGSIMLAEYAEDDEED